MGYEEIWKVLEDLVIEFRRKHEDVPTQVIEDLRAAKTMIQVLRADPTRTENIPSIEMFLGNVESYLVFTGQQKFGIEFEKRWMDKLREARKTLQKETEESILEPRSKFIPGIPRGKKWVRVQVSDDTPRSNIEALAGQLGLLTKTQEDDYVLIYGEEDKLKLFLQKVGEKLQRRNES
jgi:hypothetical protein